MGFKTERSKTPRLKATVLGTTIGTSQLWSCLLGIGFDLLRFCLFVLKNRYSAINEINKMQGNEGRIFVYFITKLSRMESGTSYVGFHGGRTKP